MEREQARRAIERVIESLPLLGYEGFYRFPRQSGPLDEWVAVQRPRMVTDVVVEQFITALASLDGIGRNKTAGPSSGVGSYSFKHYAENWGRENGMARYVSNGMGICACVHAGVIINWEPGRINCDLGLSRRDYCKRSTP